MPMDMDADLREMMDPTEFGATTATLDGNAIRGIFDAEYFEAVAGGDVGVESSQPGFLCRTSDLPASTRGLVLVADGDSYTVVGTQPDGTGATALVLEAV